MVSRFAKIKLIVDDARYTVAYAKKILPRVMDLLVVEVDIPQEASWVSVLKF